MRPLMLSKLILAVFLLLGGGYSHAHQTASSFFPSRPSHTQFQSIEGILADYAIGNKSGSFSLTLPDGKTQDFYVGWPIHIDGKTVKCAIPPTDSFKAQSKYCADWPANIRIGHTKVKVTFWDSKYNGDVVHVSDQIESIK